MKAWKKERENIEDKYMKVHNLGKEIDNLHKNIVYVEDKRGIKTSARDYIGSAANSDLIIEEHGYHTTLDDIGSSVSTSLPH